MSEEAVTVIATIELRSDDTWGITVHAVNEGSKGWLIERLKWILAALGASGDAK